MAFSHLQGKAILAQSHTAAPWEPAGHGGPASETTCGVGAGDPRAAWPMFFHPPRARVDRADRWLSRRHQEQRNRDSEAGRVGSWVRGRGSGAEQQDHAEHHEDIPQRDEDAEVAQAQQELPDVVTWKIRTQACATAAGLSVALPAGDDGCGLPSGPYPRHAGCASHWPVL